jgi:hypothetical protein
VYLKELAQQHAHHFLTAGGQCALPGFIAPSVTGAQQCELTSGPALRCWKHICCSPAEVVQAASAHSTDAASKLAHAAATAACSLPKMLLLRDSTAKLHTPAAATTWQLLLLLLLLLDNDSCCCCYTNCCCRLFAYPLP